MGDALIDEFRAAEGSSDFVGGAGLNVATGLRILDVPTRLVAMVGADADGALIRGFLSDHGVALVETTGRLGSSRAISDRTDGEPRYIFNEAARHRQLSFDAASWAALAEAALVVVSCFPFDNAQQSDALFAAVGEVAVAGGDGGGPSCGGGAGIRRLVLDPNPRAGMLSDRDEFVRNFERLAATSLLTKIGDEDCELLYSERLDAVAERLLGLGATSVLATAGRNGASIRTADGVRVTVPISAYDGSVVDTMGAGDATLASTAASIARHGLPTSEAAWRELLERAMLVAAATCRHPGALLRLP